MQNSATLRGITESFKIEEDGKEVECVKFKAIVSAQNQLE